MKHEDKTKEMLKEDIDFSQHILEFMTVGVGLTNLDGVFIYTNPCFEKMVGYNSGELIGKPASMLNAPSKFTAEETFGKIMDSLSEKGSWKGEVQCVKKDGTLILTSARATELEHFKYGKSWLCIQEDITGSKRREATHHEKESFLKTIMDTSPDIIYIYDILDKINIYSNQGSEKILGYSVEEILAMGENILPCLMHPDDFDVYLKKIFPLYQMTGDEEIIEHDYRMKHKNGTWTWLRTRETIFLRLDDGSPKQIFGIVNDITESKKAEERLARTTDILNRTNEIAKIGGWELDLPSMKLTWSLGTYHLHEVDPLTPVSVDSAIHFYAPEAQPIINAAVEAAIETGTPFDLELPLITSKGRRFWARAQGRTTTQNGKVMKVVGVLQDITERKRVEDKLQDSENKFRSLFEQAGDYIIIWEVKGENSLVVIDVNQAACKIHGFSREEFIGMSISDIDRGLTEEQSKTIMAKVMSGETVIFETKHLKKDGTLFPVEVSVNFFQNEIGPPLLIAIERDITVRKQMENEQRIKEEQLQAILHASMDGFWRVDMQGRFLEVNEAYCRMSGYSKKEILNMRVSDIVANENPDDTATHIKKIIAHGSDCFESHHHRKDGSLFYVEVSTTYHLFEGGQIVAFFRDITDRKKAEDENKRLESQLKQAQKMEAIGTLTGGVAHEFNNLMAIIMGNTELLIDAVNLEDKEALQAIFEATQRGTSIVQQMLTLSRKSEGNYRKIPLGVEIQEIKKLILPLIPRTIAISVDIADDLWWINAAKEQIGQLIMNLWLNAKDAMPEGGKLTITAQNVILDEPIQCENSVIERGRYVKLTVSDTGHGMDKKVRERIFDPFFTTREVGKGTGLGLAVVYGIVKSHNGYILCESVPSCGATFEIFFPAVMNPEIAGMEHEKDAEVPNGIATILTVDDEEGLIKMLKKMLGKSGYETIPAYSGEEALKIFKERQEEIDLILLDLSMPGMGGLKCLEQLMEIDPNAKIVIASGYSKDSLIKDCLDHGATGFIVKPFTKNEISKIIHKVLNKNEDQKKGHDGVGTFHG